MEPKNHRLVEPTVQVCLSTTGSLLTDWWGFSHQFRGWILPTMWIRRFLLQMTQFNTRVFIINLKTIKFELIYSMIRLMLILLTCPAW